MLLTVSQTPATIQLLLHTGDFVEALDLIATTQVTPELPSKFAAIT